MNQMLPRPRFWAEAAGQIRTRFTMLGETMLLMLLYFIGTMGSAAVLAVPMTLWAMGTQSESMVDRMLAGASYQEIVEDMLANMPGWMVLISLFATAVSVGFVAVFYCKKFQKRKLASMGLIREGALGEYLLGFVFGLLLFGGVVAVGAATGGFRLGAWRLSPGRLAMALAALLGCAAKGAALELLFRGYYAPSLGARYPVLPAFLLSSLIPAVLQSESMLFSMGTLNSLLLGLVLSLWVLKRGSLWGACAIQGAWTFAGSFLLDFSLTGEHVGLGLLNVDADAYRLLLSGGEFGPGSSICATVVLLAAFAVVLALRPRNSAPEPARNPDERPGNNL